MEDLASPIFVDASETLRTVAQRLARQAGATLRIHCQPDITPDQLPAVIGQATVVWIDHTALPLEIARQCPRLRHVIFLGTGARSYMDLEALAEHGITVDTISGYGDTAVAEMTVALMWAAARSLVHMDREMRAGHWARTEGIQLSGKTIGLVGFGGNARAVLPLVPTMRVLAWNRTSSEHEGVEFVELERLLAESDVVSLHLLLTAETRGFLSAQRLAMMRPETILINTSRGAIIDEPAMIDALRGGRLAHAALDVYTQEPMPPGHPLTTLPNVTLSAHSAFRTPEASENLVAAALAHLERFERMRAAEPVAVLAR